MLIIWILVVLAVLLIGWVVATYNRLIRLRLQGDNAWADVDVQLKRRHDLVPNLVETVKGYAKHEKSTFELVVEARNKAISSSSPTERAEAENQLTAALRQLFALAEAYPDLKASNNFIELQGSLNEIEEQIQLARRYYNAVVRDYNTKVQTFPSNLVASWFRFMRRDFFHIGEEERAPVRVGF